ncbi:TRAP transporter large permease [Desulfohalovibrio reitneri]|uniref:TRAP transporter large permease n=1 Tax=Desulfohalovibrio reitneri TaxID=1307759 RepID=UPI0004A6E988|nr:TRAP transporter large permease [Desulfohalovibrio reitneri]
MEPTTAGLLGIAAMLALFATRMPVAYAMAVTGFVGFSLLTSWQAGMGMLSRTIYDAFASYELSTIPLFILMGQLAFHSGISRRLYDTADHFLGHVRGGLAMATAAACTAFGAVCGSSPATAATMSLVSIPQMKRYGYADSLAAGSVASGGGLGMIMPPSVVLIVYGVLTEQSIGRLFVAGIVPALLLTVLFIAAIGAFCAVEPQAGPASPAKPWGERLRSLLGLADTLAVFLLVIGGIFLGFFTPTEAASIGVLAILALSLLKRQISWSGFTASLTETLRTSCMVLFLVAGALVFGKFLAVTRIPFTTAAWVAGMELPGIAVMAMILAVYFLGGCVMDALALIMLTIPVFYPVVQNLGYDPVWFGIVIVLVTQIGVITPPVGINVYVVYGMTRKIAPDISLESIFKGAVPFLLAILAGLGLFFLFPEIILWLPGLMY